MLVSARSCACSAKKNLKLMAISCSLSNFPEDTAMMSQKRSPKSPEKESDASNRSRHVFQDGGNSKDDIELFKIKILNVIDDLYVH